MKGVNLIIAVFREVDVGMGHLTQTPGHGGAELRTDHIYQTSSDEHLLHHTQPTEREEEGDDWVEIAGVEGNLSAFFPPDQLRDILDGGGGL